MVYNRSWPCLLPFRTADGKRGSKIPGRTRYAWDLAKFWMQQWPHKIWSVPYENPQGINTTAPMGEVICPIPCQILKTFFSFETSNEIQGRKDACQSTKSSGRTPTIWEAASAAAGLPMHIDDRPYPTKTPLKGFYTTSPKGKGNDPILFHIQKKIKKSNNIHPALEISQSAKNSG